MKKVIGIVLALLAVGAIVGYFIYNKPHRDIRATEASHQMEATALYEAYQQNASEADSTFLNEVISVSGVVLAIEEKALLLDEVVYCKLDSLTQTSDFAEGDEVNLKGRVLGYDDLFGQVRLDNCTPQKKP